MLHILRLGNIAISRLFSFAMIVIGIALLVTIIVISIRRGVKHEKE